MISKRVHEIKPFIVMDVLEKAQEMERAGASIIHLEVGEPDFDTPECIKLSVIAALQRGETHYTHSLGLLELREAVSRHYHKTYGIQSIQPDRVIITSGTSPAFFVALSAILDPGDQVILSDPHYACYPNFIRFFGGIPTAVPVYQEDGFQYRPSEIEKRITGIRPGEKLHEILVSEEEMYRTVDRGNYYAIKTMLPEINDTEVYTPALKEEYSSASDLMDRAAVEQLLRQNKLMVEDVSTLQGELLR